MHEPGGSAPRSATGLLAEAPAALTLEASSPVPRRRALTVPFELRLALDPAAPHLPDLEAALASLAGPAGFAGELHRDDLAPALEALATTVADQSSTTLELRVLEPWGAVRWLALTATARRDTTPCVTLAGVATEVTESRRGELASQAVTGLLGGLAARQHPDKLLEEWLPEIAGLLVASTLVLLEADGATWRARHRIGAPPPPPLPSRVVALEALAGASGPLLFPAPESDPRLAPELVQWLGAGPLLLFPLGPSAAPAGLVIASRPAGVPSFGPEDARLGGHLAPALHLATQDLRREVAELSARQARLEQAEKMALLGRLAGGIAHDFNNLLMGLLGCVELALRKLPLDSAARPHLLTAKDAAVKGGAIPRRLLTFSRTQPDDPVVLEVDPVMRRAAELLVPLLGEDVTLELQLEAPGGTVLGDRGELEQVLLNLLVNARDSMPGGGTITLATTLLEVAPDQVLGVPRGSYLRMAVTDTGTGMGEEVRARLFEPHFTTKAPDRGTGLGLVTVREIIHRYGGFIAVDSALGQGSTFALHLPTAAEHPTEDLPSEGEEGEEGHGRMVLLVEDAPLVRMTAKHYLEDAGYRVLEATTSLEALALARRHTAALALLLTDVGLPGMTGPQLSKAVRALAPQVRVVFMSGHSGEELTRQGRLGEGDAALQKPFGRDALLSRVRRSLAD